MCVYEREREGERERENHILPFLPPPPPLKVGQIHDIYVVSNSEVWQGIVVIDVDAIDIDGKWFLADLPARVDPRHHFIILPTLTTRHVDGVLIISGEGGFYYRRPSPLFAGEIIIIKEYVH